MSHQITSQLLTDTNSKLRTNLSALNGGALFIFRKSVFVIGILCSFNTYALSFLISSDDLTPDERLINSLLKEKILTEDSSASFELKNLFPDNCEDQCYEFLDSTPHDILITYKIFTRSDLSVLYLNLFDLKTNEEIFRKALRCNFCSTVDFKSQITQLQLLNSNEEIRNPEQFVSIFPPSLGFKFKDQKDSDLVTIEIDTSSNDADIFLDDVLYGQGKISVSAPKNSEYTLRISKPGFKQVTQKISFKSSMTVKPQFKPLTVNLVINSNIQNTQIRIDGERQGNTPINLKEVPIGSSLIIEATKQGFKDYTSEYSVTKDSKEIIVELENQIGFLKVIHDVKSSDISIYSNKNLLGKLSDFNNDIVPLPTGKQNIELRHTDSAKNKNFTIKEDRFVEWKINFIENVEVNITF